MIRSAFRRRLSLAGSAAVAAALALTAAPAAAQDKLTFLTSWYAQAEHGGFYQALATGLYRKAGLDVTIKMGGPQVNGMQLLLKMVANLFSPSDGRILWWRGGFDGVGGPGRQLAFVFQDATLMLWARVDANVRLPLDRVDAPGTASQPKVLAALEQVGLKGFDRHYPRELSGGMQMRVAIDEPHPRTEAFRVSQAFADHCRTLSEALDAASRA